MSYPDLDLIKEYTDLFLSKSITSLKTTQIVDLINHLREHNNELIKENKSMKLNPNKNKNKYIKISKKFYKPSEQLWNRITFYIDEEIWLNHKRSDVVSSTSYYRLLSLADVVIKNDQIIKYRFADLEDIFDNILL
jgi:hypothetical protein